MYKISKVLLWSFDSSKPYREIKFETEKVNVITGDSRTGKTALIACIDYVLGSSKCAIPVGVIRNKCKWYGLVIKNGTSQLLIARRSPEISITPEYYLLEDFKGYIPNSINEGNYNKEYVNEFLNSILGYSKLKLSSDDVSNFNTRPSYRDTMAFNFQPQTIIATPDILFYKVNLTEHRERLKREIDYFLNIINNEELFKREKYKDLELELKRLNRLIDEDKKISDIFLENIPSFMTEAISYGFLPKSKVLSEDAFTNLEELRKIIKNNTMEYYAVDENTLKKMHNELTDLEKKLASKYQEILRHTSFLNKIEKTIAAINDYRMPEIEESLLLTKWLSDQILNDEFLLSSLINSDVSIENIAESVKKYKHQKDIGQREIENLLEEKRVKEYSLQKNIDEYNMLSKQINEMKKSESKAKSDNRFLQNKYMFLGKIKSEIEKYDQGIMSRELREKKSNIELKIAQLQKMSNAVLEDKFNKINQKISDYCLELLSTLDCDHKDDPINFERQELTISIVTGEHKKDKDYLYEIGSASNWLSYHIAFMLALHRFFRSINNSKVFPFIVFDQPSQVYFPAGLDYDKEIKKQNENIKRSKVRTDDIEKVKKIFLTINKFAKKNDIQIIILEHAGEEMWKDLEKFITIEEWGNGSGLIPTDW